MATPFSSDIALIGAVKDEAQVAELAAHYKAWLYLGTDKPGDVQLPGAGFASFASYTALQAAHVPMDNKNLTLALAEELTQQIDALPRPLLISCGSSARAGAAALVNKAAHEHLSAEKALEFAKASGLRFMGSAAQVDWVVAAIYRQSHRRPPLFRQLFEAESSTYTYILADPDTLEAVIIDPVDITVDRDVQFINDLGLHVTLGLNTHVHADHVTGTGLLKQRIAGLRSVLAEASGGRADVKVKEGDVVRFGSYALEVRATPGHTNGCLSYVMDDRSMVFTGDALLIRGCGRTDFQQGNSESLFDNVHSKLFSLPNDTLVYPAHDYQGRTCSSIGEEKRLNPRLTKSKEEFVKIMAELGLPYPKKIDEALPLNLKCGFTD